MKGNVSKYVAQADILRLLPSKALIRTSVFRLGPVLTEVVVQRENDSNAFGFPKVESVLAFSAD